MRNSKHYINTIFYQIEQTAKYCRCLAISTFQKLDLGITFDEFIVLDTIDANGCICQRELAKLILKDRANTGRLLNSLEKKGYIERFVDTKNNRLVRNMKLTETGYQILTDSIEKLKVYIEKMPKILSDEEKEVFINSIQTFKQGLKKEVQMNI